jgi:hypothetical protein
MLAAILMSLMLTQNQPKLDPVEKCKFDEQEKLNDCYEAWLKQKGDPDKIRKDALRNCRVYIIQMKKWCK